MAVVPLHLLALACLAAATVLAGPLEDVSSTPESVASPKSPDPPESPPATFDGAQVLKVKVQEQQLLEKIIEEDNLDTWSGNTTHLDIFVPADKLPAIKQKLEENKFDFTVMIDDVDTAIRSQNPLVPEEEEELDGRKGHKMNWQKYHPLEVIHGYMDYLMETYPNLVSTGVMGYSHEGRALKYIKISAGKPNAKAVFIDGGIHAREWISPATVSYLMRELVENHESLPVDLGNLDFYIIPVLNPDGYVYTHTGNRMWRKNRARGYGGLCSGVDLNRNFAFQWGGKGTSSNPCSEVYRGTGPSSEPETQALSNFITSLRGKLKAYVTFHSYGQYILIPYGHDRNHHAPHFDEMLAVGQRGAQAMRAAGGSSYAVGNTANMLYPAAGGSDDWVKSSSGTKYSYTVELRDRGNYGFTLPAREILPTAREAFEFVKVVSAAAARE